MLRDVERDGEPVGQAAGRARRLGGRARRARARARRPPPEVLYWVGCARVVRRAGARGRTLDREAAAGGRRRLRDPRPARVLHRRSGAAHGQRVHRSRPTRSRTSRRCNGPGVTKIVTTCPHCFNTLGNEYADFGGRYEVHAPHRAAGRAGARRPARPGRQRPHDHLPRQLLPGAAQRRGGRAARTRRRRRPAGRDGAARQAHVLLRRRRRAHVDGGARQPDQRGARARRRPRRAPRRWPSPAPSAR